MLASSGSEALLEHMYQLSIWGHDAILCVNANWIDNKYELWFAPATALMY